MFAYSKRVQCVLDFLFFYYCWQWLGRDFMHLVIWSSSNVIKFNFYFRRALGVVCWHNRNWKSVYTLKFEHSHLQQYTNKRGFHKKKKTKNKYVRLNCIRFSAHWKLLSVIGRLHRSSFAAEKKMLKNSIKLYRLSIERMDCFVSPTQNRQIYWCKSVQKVCFVSLKLDKWIFQRTQHP